MNETKDIEKIVSSESKSLNIASLLKGGRL